MSENIEDYYINIETQYGKKTKDHILDLVPIYPNGIKTQDLLKFVPIVKATMSYHLNNLVRENKIQKVEFGNQNIYYK